METTARNRTIGGIVIGAIILILLLVLFSCTVNSDPGSSPTKDPTPGESSSLPTDPDTLEPDEKPSESESAEADADDIVPAANTGVTFIPAGNVPSGSTPTCELDPSACEDTRPPGAGVDICEIRPDLSECQEPEPTPPPTQPTTPPDDGDGDGELPVCDLFPDLPICDDDGPGPGEPEEDTTAPDPVTVDSCVVNSNTSVTIDWSKAKDASGISHYTVTSSPDAGNPGRTEETSATFNGLEAGVTYTFWVTATDNAGNESDDSNAVECVMDVTAPQIPQGVTVEQGDPSDSTLNVSWLESEDNTGGVGDVTYNLYRDGKLVGPVNDTSYEDTGLEAGKEYTYTVTAVDGAGNESDQSAEATGTTTKIAPTVPQNVKVTNASATGFDVSWNASTDEDGKTSQDKIVYIVEVQGALLGGLCTTRVTGETSTHLTCLLSEDGTVTVTAEDEDGNQSAPSETVPVSGGSQQATTDNPALRSSTPGKTAKSDAPAESPAPSEDAPKDEPTDENSPLLPGLDDVLPGGEDAAEAPAEEPAEPEATPSESESPVAERPTTEEPAGEATEDAPAEEDEGGLLGNIVDSVTSAVAAVF